MTLNLEGNSPIVEVCAAIAQLHLVDAQIKERVLPRPSAGLNFRTGQIAAAIFLIAHVHLRTVHHQFVDLKFPVQKRKHGEAHLHAVCVKQRSFRGSFPPVQRQVIQLGAQAQRMQMKSAQLHARARPRLQLLYQRIARPALRDPKLKNAKHRHRNRADREHDGCKPMWPAELPPPVHEPLPCATMSIFRRSRESLSHLAARSLIARWISTSRIVSSTSSSGGTVSLRAFSCGENSSR